MQVSEMTKSALVAAEQKASSAGSAILSNRYVSTRASWVLRAAEDVGLMMKEKMARVEEEKRETVVKEGEEKAFECGNERLLDGCNAISESLDEEANRYKLV